jgi:hypothetical protein
MLSFLGDVVAAEGHRFALALCVMYAYHWLWETAFIAPLIQWLIKKGYLLQEKQNKVRESLWKNIAILSFSMGGYAVAGHQNWFFNREKYFSVYPYEPGNDMRWYYMLYLSFWIQSIAFIVKFAVKRKDNFELLLHHIVTIILMISSYALGMTPIGLCVLMIHELNDLLLESAKICVYLQWTLASNVLFGLFAVTWYLVRWGFYTHNILYAVYFYGYKDVVSPMLMNDAKQKTFIHGAYWAFILFLTVLLLLQIYWGILIGKMVLQTFQMGNVSKDIRSDSEEEMDVKED